MNVYFELKKYPRYKTVLLNVLVWITIVLALVFFYLGFAFFVLFLLPVLILYIFVRYQLFKRKIKKFSPPANRSGPLF